MTVADWLAARAPAPPPALAARVREQLAGALDRDASEAPELLLDAGERLASALLRARSTSRESALDLLAADALVTYAFEAASTMPADLAHRAAEAMSRIAALGASESSPSRAPA